MLAVTLCVRRAAFSVQFANRLNDDLHAALISAAKVICCIQCCPVIAISCLTSVASIQFFCRGTFYLEANWHRLTCRARSNVFKPAQTTVLYSAQVTVQCSCLLTLSPVFFIGWGAIVPSPLPRDQCQCLTSSLTRSFQASAVSSSVSFRPDTSRDPLSTVFMFNASSWVVVIPVIL